MLLSLSLSGSGWSLSPYIGSESLQSSSGISVAQADGSNNGVTSCTATNSGLLEENGITSCNIANTAQADGSNNGDTSCNIANTAQADGSNNGDTSCNTANTQPEVNSMSYCGKTQKKINDNMIRGWGCIKGTNDKDFIQAVPNPIDGDVDNIIFGKDKPDIIFSDVGIDTVYGGAGGDTVQGGPGNDQIFGEGGDDHLFGGSDDDLIVGGSGNNHLFGDIGNDVLKGGKNSGANYFDCGEGIDIIIDFNPAKGDVTAGNCEIF
jgi:Ca2+-binding RTX toxin-like protein